MINDIQPANNFMEQFIASTNYGLIGLWGGRKIPVQFVESKHFLGTTDGQSYHLNPARDEAINDWSEKH